MNRISSARVDFLLHKIYSGDKKSLSDFYSELRLPLFLFIKSMVKNHEASEDIAQQVFIEIIQSLKTYKKNTNAKVWVFSIAKNLCIDYIKSQKKEISVENEMMEYHLNKSQGFEDKMFVYEALNQLGDKEQKIIVLYIYARFTKKEISKLLGIPYDSVRSSYAYAISKLKKIYGDHNK